MKQLADSFPKIVAVACGAHRLALACKDSLNNIRYMTTFRDIRNFPNSANCTARLKAASTTLSASDLKIKVIYLFN